MSRSVTSAVSSTPANILDGVRPKPAKAELTSQALSIPTAAIVKDALIDHYGSLKAAAITLRMDLGQLSRELQTGDFKIKKLDVDEDARRDVLSALYEAVRDDDPKVKQQRALNKARRALDDLAEAL